MHPEGVHQIACPLCNNPTQMTVNKKGEVEVGKSTERPSSSDGRTRNVYPFVFREHPIIIRERMKQRKGKKTVVMM